MRRFYGIQTKFSTTHRCGILSFRPRNWLWSRLKYHEHFKLYVSLRRSHAAERFKSCRVDNKFILTFLGKSPNAVAAKYPELIEPARRRIEKYKVSAIEASAITEWILIQFKCSFYWISGELLFAVQIEKKLLSNRALEEITKYQKGINFNDDSSSSFVCNLHFQCH